MDISNSDHTGTFNQSGEVEKVPACFADDTLCTSFYFNNDPVWYASYFPFSIWRTDQYNHSGFGGKATNLIDSATAFRTIYISSSVWQDAGWGTIIYIATLSSVDASLHEAARVDGATPLQRIFYIDIPELVPVIVIQLIMSFGNLMNVGFEKAYLLQTSLNKATSEIIATYVYEQGLLKAMYSFSTAVGLFNTVVNIVLLVVVNTVCKRLSDVSFI